MSAAELIFLHGRHTPECTAAIEKHFDGYFTVQFSPRCGLELFYDDARHELHGPMFWPAYPGPLIKFHLLPGVSDWPHYYCAFQGPLASRWFAQGLYPMGPQPAPRGVDHAGDFERLYTLMYRGDAWAHRRAINLLEGILLELAEARIAPESAQRPEWLDRVTRQLDKADAEPDYEGIARSAGMGLSTLRRRFRMATGLAVHAYALQQRMILARELLGESDLPIKAIADRLGYRDVYFFSRQFRQKVGVPPAVYRRSRQG